MKRITVALLTSSYMKFKGFVSIKDNTTTITGDLYVRKFSPIVWIMILLIHIISMKSMFVTLFVDKKYVQRIKDFFNEPMIEDVDQVFTFIEGTSKFRKILTVFCLKYT